MIFVRWCCVSSFVSRGPWGVERNGFLGPGNVEGMLTPTPPQSPPLPFPGPRRPETDRRYTLSVASNS